MAGRIDRRGLSNSVWCDDSRKHDIPESRHVHMWERQRADHGQARDRRSSSTRTRDPAPPLTPRCAGVRRRSRPAVGGPHRPSPGGCSPLATPTPQRPTAPLMPKIPTGLTDAKRRTNASVPIYPSLCASHGDFLTKSGKPPAGYLRGRAGTSLVSDCSSPVPLGAHTSPPCSSKPGAFTAGPYCAPPLDGIGHIRSRCSAGTSKENFHERRSDP